MLHKTILLIDDEQICVDSVEMILENTDYKLLSATNAKAALEILESSYSRVNLILLDLMLLDCHGLELLDTIKKNNNFKNIPVILQTGSNNERDISTGMAMGAIFCIYKPYKRTALLSIIDKVLQN